MIIPTGGFSATWILLIVFSTALGFLTKRFLDRTFAKWSQVPIETGETGAQVARRILDGDGLGAVAIDQVAGELSDHYDPRTKQLGLSRSVFAGTSVAAAGVAAHEAGHAIQDARHYVWGNVRSALVPVVGFASQAAFPLIFVGLFFQAFSVLTWVGIAFYAGAVLFQIVTLPVEFDASKRALASLETSGMSAPQLAGARQVLTAAALTYVAAALISVMQLLYFMGVARGRD